MDVADDTMVQETETSKSNGETVKVQQPIVKSTEVTEAEYEYYRATFKDISSVKYRRIHCTSCDKHLGSAPSAQRFRCEHPLLKVLMCSSCFDFYSSGEFEKDQDGSELYCRWCGQGGQVYCCAQCPFVFCKKCIKRNFGQAMVNKIEHSDDWLCFACRPDDIWTHRATNWAIRLYSSDLMAVKPADRTPQQIIELTLDSTICCNNVKTKKSDIEFAKPTKKERNAIKRASNSHEEKAAKKMKSNNFPRLILPALNATMDPENYLPMGLVQHAPNTPMITEENSDEVVCTPDILGSFMEEEEYEAPVPPSEPVLSPPNVTHNSNARESRDSDDDCKIIDDPPPKKAYVQVKPASKLLEPPSAPAKTVRSHLPQQAPPPVYTRPLTKVTCNEPPPLVKSANAVEIMPKQPILPDNVQKMIKIVSPDGRSFFLDPAKIVQQVQSGPIVLQTVPPVSGPVPPPPLPQQMPAQLEKTKHKKIEWFEKAMIDWRNISQFITMKLTELLQMQRYPSTDPEVLYSHFQFRIQSTIEKMEELKRALATNYFLNSIASNRVQNIPGFGQHFLSNSEIQGIMRQQKNDMIPHNYIDDGIPPLTALANIQIGNSPNVNIPPPLTMIGNPPHLPIMANSPILGISENQNDLESHNSESLNMITGDIPESDEIQQSLIPNSVESHPVDGDTNELAQEVPSSNEVSDQSVLDRPENPLGEPLLRKALDGKIKFASELKSVERRPRKSTLICHPCDGTDSFYDIQVTCGSDESDDEPDDVKDSDYVAEEDEESDSVSSVILVNDDDDDDIQEIVEKPPYEIEDKQPEVVVEDLTGDDEPNIILETTLLEKLNNGENDLETKEEDNLEDKDDKYSVLKDTSELETNEDKHNIIEPNENEDNGSGDGSSINLRIESRSEKDVDDASRRSDENKSSENDCNKNIDSHNSYIRKDVRSSYYENNINERSLINSEEDLAAIAEAIRESIKDAEFPEETVSPRKSRTPSENDLEELLTSNVVYKRSDVNSPIESPRNQENVQEKLKNSFGDAFSSFIANVSESSEDGLDDREGEKLLNETKLDLENEMEEIERLVQDRVDC